MDKNLGDINDDQYVAVNAPQPWLPCFKPTGDPNIDKILDMAANGGIMETSYSTSEKTGSGGIILFDEFLRAKPAVFDQLMNFLLERKISGYTLGSKWFIIACSVRPCDDNLNSDNWRVFGAALRQRRAGIYHMEPDPESWKKWAKKRGFDKTLMKFIFDESPESFINGEYTRWYRVANKDFIGKTSNNPITPRTWMYVNNELIEYKNYNKKFEDVEYGDLVSHMTIDEVKEVIGPVLGKDFTNELLDWLKNYKNNSVDLNEIEKDPTGTQLMIHTNQSH